MSLQVELDESLLGGLVVRVGGEVIDGSVAGRLEAARRHPAPLTRPTRYETNSEEKERAQP